MLIKEIPCEVETILDKINWADRFELDIKKEILYSMGRKKMVDKITDDLSKVAKSFM